MWINAHGHWLVLRSAQLNRRCACVEPDTGRANQGCRTCLATGYQFVDYVVRGCKSFGLPDFDIDTPVGQAPVGTTVYYLEYVVPVKRDDLVLEIELSPEDGTPITPTKIRDGFKVTQVEDMRDASGRVEFWQIRVERLGVRPA